MYARSFFNFFPLETNRCLATTLTRCDYTDKAESTRISRVESFSPRPRYIFRASTPVWAPDIFLRSERAFLHFPFSSLSLLPRPNKSIYISPFRWRKFLASERNPFTVLSKDICFLSSYIPICTVSVYMSSTMVAMEEALQGGKPQTPYLHPQDIPEEDEQVPDFFLDDDAGVGSPMDFSDEDCTDDTPSLSTILALGQALSPCASPAPSLVSDVSLLSEVSVMSDSDCSGGTFKMKKLVRFLDSVEIVPYCREEPRTTGPLKPPQEPPQYVMRKLPGSSHEDYSKPEDIGILYGLGRAGSPRSSSLLHLQKREFNTRRPNSPPTDISESEDEDDDTPFGRRVNQFRRQQRLTVPLFPPPSWRTTPEKPHHDLPPRVKSPGEMDGYTSYEDARYILGQTSPTGPSSPVSFSPPPPTISFSPPHSPQPQPGDGVYRHESNFRNSQEYNGHPVHHPQPQRHSETIKAYSYWIDGEIRYEDQWGRRIYPKDKGNGNMEFTLDLWPVKEDVMDEDGTGGGKLAVPGGRMTLREQRLRARGSRRR